LSILIATFFLSNIVTYAQKENNPFTEIALTQAKRKDPISKGDTPISRSIIQTCYDWLDDWRFFFKASLRDISLCAKPILFSNMRSAFL